MLPSVRKAAITESYICKSCCGYGEFLAISHDQILHDTLAGSHDIYRVCSLVCRYTEEMLGRINAKQVHQLLGLNIVILYQSLNAIFIFFTANMLMS